MTLLLGVIVGGLAMWRWRDVVRDGLHTAREQWARGDVGTVGTAVINTMKQGRESDG